MELNKRVKKCVLGRFILEIFEYSMIIYQIFKYFHYSYSYSTKTQQTNIFIFVFVPNILNIFVFVFVANFNIRHTLYKTGKNSAILILFNHYNYLGHNRKNFNPEFTFTRLQSNIYLQMFKYFDLAMHYYIQWI
jgi:hypothetical protein